MKQTRGLDALRVAARGWSVLAILFTLFVVATGQLPWGGLGSIAFKMLALSFFPIGLLLGLLIGWRHEGIGGFVGLLSLAGFYVFAYLSQAAVPGVQYIVVLFVPCLLFMLYWIYQAEAAHLLSASDDKLRGNA